MTSSDPLPSPPSTDEVVAAIRILYHDPDPREKERASQWLNRLQQSVHAWTAADQLLHAKIDLESCYIAAQTIRTKIQLSFHELPAHAHAPLKDSLLQHVDGVDETTSAIIVTQLCLALADLILQMPEWKDAVPELMARYATNRPFALLQVLVVLPEEVNSRTLRLGANRREVITEQLTASAHMVAEFLRGCLASDELCRRIPQVRLSLLRCLSSWIQLGAMPLQGIERNEAMIFAFQVMQDVNAAPGLHEAASDCVISLLESLERLDYSQPWTNNLEVGLFDLVKNLEGSYHVCVATEDNSKAISFCRVFTELAESLLFKIVHNSNAMTQTPYFATAIFDSVLMCCGHPTDYDIPDITFNLWYRLSEELYQRGDVALTVMFAPYIERLITALCRHCQMEVDTEGVLEDGEDFPEFRNRCVELIKDVVFIVGSSTIFRRMFENLKGVDPGREWYILEATIFVMSAVAKMILPSEKDAVPEVLERVLSMPLTTHVAVRHASLKLVGELGEWIDQQPQYLERILNWLLAGLQDPKLSSEAATALQNISSMCKRHMVPHFEGLTQILKSLDTFALKPNAANGLLKGVVTILSIMPHEQIHSNMLAICWLQVAPLKAILDQQQLNGQAKNPAAGKNTSSDPVLYLDRISVIFRFVTPTVPSGAAHPCLAVVQELWPVLSRAFEQLSDNVRVMERCCRTVRFAVRCVGTQSAPLLESLVKQMVVIYSAHPHSCFLYLGSILVDEFSHLPGCVSGLLSMLQAFLPATFAILQKENGLKNHPDTVDDFFRLNARFIQRCPLPYLQTNFVNPIVECALLSVYLEHRDANASVLKFLFDVLHAGRSKEDREDFAPRQALAAQVRAAYGDKLVDGLVKATSVHQLPSYTFHDIGDVLYELMLFDRTVVCKWLEESLKALPTTKPNGVETVTIKQLSQYHKEVTMAETPRDVADAVRQFSRLWR